MGQPFLSLFSVPLEVGAKEKRREKIETAAIDKKTSRFCVFMRIEDKSFLPFQICGDSFARVKIEMIRRFVDQLKPALI